MFGEQFKEDIIALAYHWITGKPARIFHESECLLMNYNIWLGAVYVLFKVYNPHFAGG